jgi:Malonyl-CoA decarboxylase C-terminal domain
LLDSSLMTIADHKQTYRVDELEFREITSPANPDLLTLLSEKEAVHPASAEVIQANRMTPENADKALHDKHCYGLFAPGQDLPEAVVYVKLMQRNNGQKGYVPNEKLTGNIKPILNEAAKPITEPNSAFFYSISNMAFTADGKLDANHPNIVKSGLDGIKIGERLIQDVAAHLQKTHHISTLSTLSPMRAGTGDKAKGFAQWLQTQLAEKGGALFTQEEKLELDRIKSLVPSQVNSSYYEFIDYLHHHHILLKSFDDGSISHSEIFVDLMKSLGLMYLVDAKSTGSGLKVLDPVEQFHISNGAIIGNIQYLPAGKTTESESVGALGLMANYRYEPEYLAERKKSYATDGKVAIDLVLAERYDARTQLLGKTPQTAITTPIDAYRAPQGLGQQGFAI